MRLSNKNRKFLLILTDSAKLELVETRSFEICLFDLFGKVVFVGNISVKDFKRSETVKNSAWTIVVFRAIVTKKLNLLVEEIVFFAYL